MLSFCLKCNSKHSRSTILLVFIYCLDWYLEICRTTCLLVLKENIFNIFNRYSICKTCFVFLSVVVLCLKDELFVLTRVF